jgi:hypothetical protein
MSMENLKSPVRAEQSWEERMAARGQEVTPEENALGKFIYARYLEAKKFRAQYDKDWDKWWKVYLGDHWDTARPDWKSAPKVNYTFATIETIAPIMTDGDPQITVAPQRPEDLQISEIHGHIQKAIWARNKMRGKLVKYVKNGLVLGDGIIKCWFNADACDGMGDVEYSIVDNRHFFPSPGALDIQDAAYCIFAANMPINYIERMYPSARGKIVAGVWEEDLGGNRTFSSSTGSYPSTGPIAGTDGTVTLSNTSWAKSGVSPTQEVDRGHIATLIEMWHRIDGKVWVTVFANGIQLRHSRSPFRHNRYPFVKWSNYPIPSSFWSMGEVQQLESLQRFINSRRGQIQDLLRICSNPPIVADANSGINPKAMTGRPGVILYKNQGTDVHWMPTPNIPSALFQVQQLDKGDFDSISGIYDVTKGRDPGNIEAAKAITALQEAAQTRVRLKVRNLEDSLQELGEQSVALVQQYYTEERVIRMVGGNPSAPDFMVINKKIVDKIGNEIKINDVGVGKYDVEIGVGSTMPVNKTARSAEMKELFQLGIVDAQAVLENSTLPAQQVAAISERMKKAQMEQMQAEQGAVAPEGGGGQPPPPVTDEEIASLEAS